MAKFWIEEFLYRGRDPEGAEPCAYHIVLGQTVEDINGGKKVVTTLPLTEEQAAKHGFTIEKIIGDINKGVLAEHDALKTAHSAVVAERDALVQRAEAASAEIERLNAALAKAVEDQAQVPAAATAGEKASE